jgi:hypothetical protein
MQGLALLRAGRQRCVSATSAAPGLRLKWIRRITETTRSTPTPKEEGSLGPSDPLERLEGEGRPHRGTAHDTGHAHPLRAVPPLDGTAQQSVDDLLSQRSLGSIGV